MNNYLLLLGGNFSEVRQLLNLTQEDLANRMGVSRPTIVKIEQDPSRLTKSLAFAYFIAISYEMRKRIKGVKELDPYSYKSPDTLKKFVDEIRKSSLLPIGTLATIATIGLGALLPGIGAAIGTIAGIKLGLKSKKTNLTEDVIKESIKWDEEKAKKLIEEVQRKLAKDQKKVLSCFQLNSFDTEHFVEKIEEGEIVEVW